MNEPSMTAGPATPDNDILPENPFPKTESDAPQDGAPSDAPHVEEIKPTLSPKKTRELAAQVWGMIIQLMAAVFGPAMLPRKYVAEGCDLSKGEIPYDENGMVIDAWADYLGSLGLVAFSPLVNLWLAICAYFLPRLTFIIIRVKQWFSKGSAPQTPRQPSQSTPQGQQPGQSRQPGQSPPQQPNQPQQPTPAMQPGKSVTGWQGQEWQDV